MYPTNYHNHTVIITIQYYNTHGIKQVIHNTDTDATPSGRHGSYHTPFLFPGVKHFSTVEPSGTIKSTNLLTDFENGKTDFKLEKLKDDDTTFW